jgi:hypothetical protein
MNTLGRMALTATAMALAGCSAIQVDVDVYKGPLLHTPEVQLRQYAYMAISAKPLIDRLTSIAQQKKDGCLGKTTPACMRSLELHRFLLTIKYMYEGDDAERTGTDKKDNQRTTQSKLIVTTVNGAKVQGIEELTAVLTSALQAQARHGKSDATRKEVRVATDALNEVLIWFAQQILFVVNNETLFKELAGDDGETITAHKQVLQSLANTLLVHANDLSRQRDRQEAQLERKVAEQRAIHGAFSMTPEAAFERIVKAAAVAVPGTTVLEKIPENPPDPRTSVVNELNGLKEKRKSALDGVESFRTGQANLLAAMQTIVTEPPSEATDLAKTPSSEERASRRADREAVQALYKSETAATDADRTVDGALSPLRDWLKANQVQTNSTDRSNRLALALAYLDRLAQLMQPLKPEEAPTKAHVKAAMTGAMQREFATASTQLAGRFASLKSLDSSIETEQGRLAQAEEVFKKAVAETRAAAARNAEGLRVQRFLEQHRKTVLDQARNANVSDAGGVHALLRRYLAELTPTTDDLSLTRSAVARSIPALGPPCDGNQSEGTPGCTAKDQMAALDELIAALRAQRVAALADGLHTKAEDLLAAINAAHEQRTAMIYLRPASDYLLSVHSASALQTASETVYRNMLDDWMRYLPRILHKDRDDLETERRLELEKLYWQNINRVTLDGGGFTNFVIAKDDVGNWYVKAYSSDPEAIYKSAINLGLFNAGARLNTNLLQRQKLQERLDSNELSETERLRAENRLDSMTEKESRPLMTLRARYANQYETATVDGGKVLYATLGGASGSVNKALDSTVTAGGGEAGSCTAEALKPSLGGLEDAHLKEPIKRLKTLIDDPNSAPGGKLVEAYEGAIVGGLVSMHAYSRAVARALNDSTATNCSADLKRKAASRAAESVRVPMLQRAKERRLVIERYEEALSNITDVSVAR